MTVQITKAMVLAAGRGERLRPLTDTMPKPLVEVGGRSMLERQLDMMAHAGVTQAVVNCSWLAEQIQQRMQARNAQGDMPQIYLSHEQERLETGGGIVRALPILGDAPFFVSNADVVVVDAPHSRALERLKAAWDDATMDALLLLHPRERAIGFEGAGDFFLEANGEVRRRGQHVSAPYVFTGMQILHPRIFDGMDTSIGAFSLNLAFNQGATTDGTLPRIHGLVHDGDWLHVGDAQGLHLAQEYMQEYVFNHNGDGQKQ